MRQLLLAVACAYSMAFAESALDSLFAAGRASELVGNITQAEKAYQEARRAALEAESPLAVNETNSALRRLGQLRRDFAWTQNDLLRELARDIEDFAPAELADWEQRGLLDTMLLDGNKRYLVGTVTNAAFRDSGIRLRHRNWPFGWADLNLVNRLLEPPEPAHSFQTSAAEYLAESRIRIRTQGIPAGKTLRVWLPFPALKPEQPAAFIIDYEPKQTFVLVPDRTYPNSSVYVELPASGGPQTDFSMSFFFSVDRTDCSVDHARVGTTLPGGDFARHFTQGQPNLVVSPDLRTIASGITGGEANPYLAARKIYRWVVRNVSYGILPRSASMVDGLSDYVYQRRFGDGAGQAALFSSLCRAAGVPARVVGGVFIPAGMAHCWAECYVPNYGWIPVDPAMCVLLRDMPGLDEEKRLSVEEFFFGHLDNFRVATCQESDWAELAPPGRGTRTDSFVFVAPEAERESGTFSPEEIEYRLDVKRLFRP